MIERTETLFKPIAKQEGVDLSITVPDNSIYLQADPGLIEQVLVNLTKNAIEAVKEKEGAKVTLNLQKQRDGKISITVADNGKGIEEIMLEQIFVPFFTTKKEGSGIGLSLSRQIMRMHKGNITVQSEEGEGTVFTLSF